MARRLVALLAVALLSAAACGDSGDDGATPEGEDDAAASQSVSVKATDFAFDPTTIEVEPGERIDVTFVNGGNVAHTFTADAIDVDVEAAVGEENTSTLALPDEDTTIEYHCSFHPSMRGEIVVGAGGSDGGSSGEGSDDFDY